MRYCGQAPLALKDIVNVSDSEGVEKSLANLSGRLSLGKVAGS